MQEVSVGGLLRRFAGLLRLHWGLLVGLTALLVALPNALALEALRWLPRDSQGWGAAIFVVYWLGGLLLQAAVARVAEERSDGRLPTFGVAIGTAARFFPPVLAISVLTSLGFAVAGLLLVVPAIMIACRWFVVVPVEVAEQSGVFAAFRRSAALTKGVRWRVFGALLVVTLANIVIAAVVGALGGVLVAATHVVWPTLAASVIGTSVSLLSNAVLYAATYRELRETREGALSENLVAVFA